VPRPHPRAATLFSCCPAPVHDVVRRVLVGRPRRRARLRRRRATSIADELAQWNVFACRRLSLTLPRECRNPVLFAQ